MSDNPYQPSAVANVSAAQPVGYFYKSTTLLTKWLTGLLILSAILTAVVGLLDVAGYALIPGYATGDFEMVGAALSISLAMFASGVGGVLVYLVCIVLFLIWVHRSTGNAHALGANGITVTPGWAVGYWFIPILNLFRPYQAMCEIFRASDSPDRVNWSSHSVPGFFGVWWFCWIVGNILSRIELRANLRGFDLGPAAIPLSISSTLLSFFAAILVVMVVRSIANAQQVRAEGTADPGINQDPWAQRQ